MNAFEVIQVHDDLQQRGIVDYSLRPGNDCVWVSYGQVDCYYIFREGKIAEVQFD